ncbi:MAG: hypothetical protein JKY66_09745 [Spongiibacteraceae bacterium]|nr:hypothetical protein [Spongiibacteraceae bacterium]
MDSYKDTSIVDLAGIVAEKLQQHDISVVLVGGLAVEIYSENLYLTKDIDMVNTSYHPSVAINQAMREIGFTKKGRVYISDTTDICVEFPSAPLSVGEELIQETTIIEVSTGKIPILLAKDVIKDRLVAYFHWNDRPSLVQAMAVMSKHEIDANELKAFFETEGKMEEYALIERLQMTIKAQSLSSMEEIEALVVEWSIEQL